jgi:hypothetical protein
MTTCSLCTEPANADPCADCVELFDLAAPATDIVTEIDNLTEVPADPPMDWLEPTDGAEVVTEARTAVVKSFVKAAARKTATIQLVITDSAPPLEPGEKPPLKFEPCDCEPRCIGRVVGTRHCRPCKSTLNAEKYQDHLTSQWHRPNWHRIGVEA